VDKASRLQFWFTETGTLWVDDVQIVPVSGIDLTFTQRIEPVAGSRNLLPNGSFEAGTDGWSSLGKRTGWGNLSSLHGHVWGCGARDGGYCLWIDLCDDIITPVTYFDYFDPVRIDQRSPLAANVGWIKVEKGKKYTLSAWMQANPDGVPGVLMFRMSEPGTWINDHPVKVTLSHKWQRYSATVEASKGWMSVAVGPDLSGVKEPMDAAATVWIDSVQLEQGDAPSDFVPRQPVEVGLEAEPVGNVFEVGDPVKLTVRASNATGKPVELAFTATATDFFGVKAEAGKCALSVPGTAVGVSRPGKGTPPGHAMKDWTLALKDPGHYAVDVTWQADGKPATRRLYLAITRPYPPATDSPFGINHAPPSEELCWLLRRAGVVWARDWSLKWQTLEPEPGKFDPTPGDVQVDRVLAAGMKQMCLLPPFPSSNWASEAAGKFDTKGYPGVRLAMAFAPKDPALLDAFIERCVKHFKGRVNVWDFLNEPIYTDYSLPAAGKGVAGAKYTVADYVRLLKGAYAAMKRGDPACRVLGGIGSGPDGLVPEFIAAGGLDCCDLLNLHIYPGKAPPEGFLAPMAKLAERMRLAGKVKPVWITEYSYYAADDPPWEPFIAKAGDWAGPRLLDDERQCADYSVRFAVVMLASGVEKLFYHAGSSGEVNAESLECCLLRYGGKPRKVYVAQSAMANVLGPQPKFAQRLTAPVAAGGSAPAEGVYAFAFDCAGRAVVVGWADPELAGEGWRLGVPKDAEVYNIVGRRLEAGEPALGSSPLYVVAAGAAAKDLAATCRLLPPATAK
jgi:hypothetical protein